MSIPVEKRDLGDGWGLTCHGEDGGDLTLSDVKIKRENLICQIMGGDALFFPMFTDDDAETASISGSSVGSAPVQAPNEFVEESILDHIRELILQAQRHGCWKAGVGGIGQVGFLICLLEALGSCVFIELTYLIRNHSHRRTDMLLLCCMACQFHLFSTALSNFGGIWR